MKQQSFANRLLSTKLWVAVGTMAVCEINLCFRLISGEIFQIMILGIIGLLFTANVVEKAPWKATTEPPLNDNKEGV